MLPKNNPKVFQNLVVLLDALRNHNMEQLVVKCRAVSCRDQILDKRIKLDNRKLNNWLDKERNSTSDAGVNFQWWIRPSHHVMAG